METRTRTDYYLLPVLELQREVLLDKVAKATTEQDMREAHGYLEFIKPFWMLVGWEENVARAQEVFRAREEALAG